jgi:two-component system, NtrC family, nitrogen regulation response regulator NtrX
VAHLFAFLLQATGATDGVLLARSYEADRQPAEIYRVYDRSGQPLSIPTLVPFAQSLAGSVVSMQRPCLLLNPEQNAGVPLQPFERGRHSLLAAPLSLSSGLQVVLELFDKEGGFNDADRQLAAAAADFGGELFRQALAGHQVHRVLFDAVAAALGASDEMAASLRQGLSSGPEEPPPEAVLDRLRSGLQPTNDASLSGPDTVRLAEAVRELAIRHGSAAVRHCIQLIESLRTLLDDLT